MTTPDMNGATDSDPGFTALAGRIERRIIGYAPTSPKLRACWPVIGEPVRAAVRASAPEDEDAVTKRMHICAGFTAWAYEHGLSLRPDRLYTEDNVEWYVSSKSTSLKGRSRLTRTTYRSLLRAVGRSVTKPGTWPPATPRIVKGDAKHPYSADEIRWLQEIAPVQSTRNRVRVARASIGLCYGAGARPSELVDVLGDDIERVDGVVVARLRGKFAREVPVLPNAAGDLWDLAGEFPHERLFSMQMTDSKCVSDALAQVEIPQEAPRLESLRLRQTWMVRIASLDLRLPELRLLAG